MRTFLDGQSPENLVTKRMSARPSRETYTSKLEHWIQDQIYIFVLSLSIAQPEIHLGSRKNMNMSLA
jgi:hypothetical protein